MDYLQWDSLIRLNLYFLMMSVQDKSSFFVPEETEFEPPNHSKNNVLTKQSHQHHQWHLNHRYRPIKLMCCILHQNSWHGHHECQPLRPTLLHDCGHDPERIHFVSASRLRGKLTKMENNDIYWNVWLDLTKTSLCPLHHHRCDALWPANRWVWRTDTGDPEVKG